MEKSKLSEPIEFPEIDGWKAVYADLDCNNPSLHRPYWIFDNTGRYVAFLSSAGSLSIRKRDKRTKDGRSGLKPTGHHFNSKTQLKQAVTIAYLLSQDLNL